MANSQDDTFEHDKQKHPWLTMLMEAYQIIDDSISEAIKREETLGRTLPGMP